MSDTQQALILEHILECFNNVINNTLEGNNKEVILNELTEIQAILPTYHDNLTNIQPSNKSVLFGVFMCLDSLSKNNINLFESQLNSLVDELSSQG